MDKFVDLCKWLGNNRPVAVLLGMLTAGLAWGCAGVGRSVDSRTDGDNLLRIWGNSAYGGMLRTTCIIAIVGGALTAVLSLFGGLYTIVFFILVLLPSLLAILELHSALKTGADSFALSVAYLQDGETEDGGAVARSVYRNTSGWPVWPRRITGALWMWILGSNMIGLAIALVVFYLLILVISWLGNNRSSDSGRIVYAPSESRIKDGEGGLFSEVVATRDGNRILAGYGGPLADVLATIEGSQIKKGNGGPFAEVLATVEGNQIKVGNGGPFADVIATIEGDKIKAGNGGLFAETVYTVE